MGKLALVALKFAPVHRLHLYAYREAFLRSHGPAEVCWVVSDEYRDLVPPGDKLVAVGPGHRYRNILWNLSRQRRTLSRLTSEDLFSAPAAAEAVHVLVQATHPANSPLMKRLRHLFPNASIRYYLHEPTSWTEKIRRGNGLLRSTAVYLAQRRDLQHVDLYYVANRKALESAGQAFPTRSLRSRGHVLPLAFPDLYPRFREEHPGDADRSQILMMGRADNRRCLDLFLDLAAEAARRQLPWQFVLLGSNSPHIPDWALALPNLRIRIGRRYSDQEMGLELARSSYVFNLYRVKYTTSGVTPVALMFGVPVIARDQERHTALSNAGCIYLPAIPTAMQLIEQLQSSPAADHSALRAFYKRTFDASALAVP